MNETPPPADHIDPQIARRLQDGTFDEPFSILGPHTIDGVNYVTAIDPGAQTLAAVCDGKSYPLTPLADTPSIFSSAVPDAPYRLHGSDGTREWDYDDAYRFAPVIEELDEYLLAEGTHQRIWQSLGAHVMEHEGVSGTHFAVWAPNAQRVSVIGGFNHWDARRHVMRRRGGSGIWEVFIPEIGDGEAYKYDLIGANGEALQKADPVGFGSQHPPETASVVRDISGYGWKDDSWMTKREALNNRAAPISIYEVHLGSWRRKMDDGGRPLSYREAAVELINYVADMGFTHIELMPISEFPFDGSWGYQPVGMYAPTIRFGPPHEFRDLVDAAHNKGLGILIDWVPAHFPTDAHGLAQFDGTHLYEHADPREGFHHDWNTLIYNFGRNEVANFLVSNALYWLEEYHLDGLRVDAVASMLYRDYSRKDGEWVPNIHGGRENLESIELMKRLNTVVYGEVPGIMTAAEESTSFPGVSRPVDGGGLGFGFKWNMGWMNDTLAYIQNEPIHRKYHHHQMTFGLHYAFSENFILPISHDEVVHGKGSMLQKMPGNDWEKFANLRAYYGYMWGHPGKKLLFMGCEFAQGHEWQHDEQIAWDLLENPQHKGMQSLVRDLNAVYRGTPAMHRYDCEEHGFEWIEMNDAENSIFAWIRRGDEGDAPVVVVCNFTPIERRWKCGFPAVGDWHEIINSDADIYGGGNRGNFGSVAATADSHLGQPASAEITLPPLSTLMFKLDSNKRGKSNAK